jgi:hypothetical protein
MMVLLGPLKDIVNGLLGVSGVLAVYLAAFPAQDFRVEEDTWQWQRRMEEPSEYAAKVILPV